MRKNLSVIVLALVVAALAVLIFTTSRRFPEEAGSAEPALVKVELKGRLELDMTGVPGSVTSKLLSDDPAATRTLETLARRQVSMLYLQTIFRDPALPLPFDHMELSLEKGAIDGQRERMIVPYVLSGQIVAPEESLLESIEDLSETGAEYVETFIVPADPRNMFQRLGFACANQDEIPLGQVDDKNYGSYFDPFCAPGVQLCAHPDGLPLEPCLQALSRENGVGVISAMFTRLPYDQALADEWSVPAADVTRGAADLTVDEEKLADYDIIYKEFAPDSCAVAEKCVGGPGMRRLLRFRAVTPNIGDRDLVFGDVEKLKDGNQFAWSECHQHYHFNGYGVFGLEKDGKRVLPGAKQSFCVESTGRYASGPDAPFTSPYQTCDNQGITAGWEDEYFIGLDCQWIDITDLPISGDAEEFDLTMEVNPEKLLCEGVADPERLVPALHDDGSAVLGPNGKPAMKQACDGDPSLYANNKASVKVRVPSTGSAVTSACGIIEFGAMRNCGWSVHAARTCTAGQRVTGRAAGELLRVCPGSVPCDHDKAVASVVGRTAEFTCPDAGEYLLLSGAYLSE